MFGKEIGNGVWDQKVINEIKRSVKRSKSPSGGQRIRGPRGPES